MSPRVALPRADKFIQWLLPAAIILVWQAASVLIATRFLPAPTDVAAAAWRLLMSGELFRSIWVSTWRAIAGFVIGGAI